MVKNPLADVGDSGSIPGSGISPGRGNGNPFMAGEFHAQRSLAGYRLWSHKGSDMTEYCSLHRFSLL